MHLHNSSSDTNDTIVAKARNLIGEKLAEHGFVIERKQTVAVIVLLLVMIAGCFIVYGNSRPHPVSEFSADNDKTDGGASGADAQSDTNANTNNVGGRVGDGGQVGSNTGDSTPSNKAKSASAYSAPTNAANAERLITVHVAGAVARPGVYQLKETSRINDAINAAGGGVPMSDINALNLAEKVVDGEKIYVPKRGEVSPPGSQAAALTGSSGAVNNNGGVNSSAVTAGSGSTSGSSIGLITQLDGSDASRIDLNTASIEQLDTLPGVGQVTAQRIIDYRTQHGSFKSVDELKEVDGIGPKKFDQLKPHVVVN